jgi:hypothetical protein
MKTVILIILLVLALLALVRYLELKSLFFPMKLMESTPADVNLSYEEARFSTEDHLQLHGWYLDRGASFTLLLCHGNGGNISHRLEKAKELYNLNANVFMFDYRGYGKSDGKPSEKGLYRDVQAAYRYLIDQKKIPARQIVVYGESLGGAVAVDLASKVVLRALVVESTFSSVRDMSKSIYPAVPSVLVRNIFDSKTKIRSISVPKLMMHSGEDEIVPFALGEKLFAAAAEPKRFVKLRGGHNSCFLDDNARWREAIRNFMADLEA